MTEPVTNPEHFKNRRLFVLHSVVFMLITFEDVVSEMLTHLAGHWSCNHCIVLLCLYRRMDFCSNLYVHCKLPYG